MLQTMRARRMVRATRPRASRFVGSLMSMQWVFARPFMPSLLARMVL